MQVRSSWVSAAACTYFSQQSPAEEFIPFMSFTKQTLPHNSIDRELSEVSLEMLNNFLVINGINNMSLSDIVVCVDCMDEYGEALYDINTFPI